jgi:transcriptional regulator with XRE-family HTH domain
MSFAKTFRAAMKREGKTQPFLCKATGCTQPYISRLGKDRLPQKAEDLWRVIEPFGEVSRRELIRAYVLDLTPPQYRHRVSIGGRRKLPSGNLSPDSEDALRSLLEAAPCNPAIDTLFQKLDELL